jgi:hypothetical protein
MAGSLCFPVSVDSQEELGSVRLGLPVAFISQDFSRYTPNLYPQEFNIGSPWEDPFHFIWGNLTLSFFGLLIFLNVALFMIRKIILLTSRLL